MGSPHLPPPPLLEPAWYPDPTGRYEARYWDGRKWTSHISHYGATGADPLLRARWDRVWVRAAGRVILWGGLAVAAYWAYSNYWPDDERNLEAEQGVVTSAVLTVGDLPADIAWSPSSSVAASPMALAVEVDGEISVAVCEPFAGRVADASDEPRARSGFDGAEGLRSVANITLIGGGVGFAEDYLEQLRSDETGECLSAIWTAGSRAGGVTVASVQPMSEPSFGDEAVWWRLSGNDTGSAFGVGVFADVVVVRVDRVVSEFTFTGTVDPVGVDLQRGVISLQTARIGELLTALEAEEDEPADDG